LTGLLVLNMVLLALKKISVAVFWIIIILSLVPAYFITKMNEK